MRLGLVIGEIGDKQKLQVSQDELKRALIEQARRYPGQERFVYEYYEKNPAALVELRAPIFEDKVIDHILELAKPAEKKVTPEELLKPVAGDDDALAHVHHHDHAIMITGTTIAIMTITTVMIMTITTIAMITTATIMRSRPRPRSQA